MATVLTVTPGTTFNPSSVVDADMLNAAASPTVTIGDGSLPADAINALSFINTFGDSFRAINYLPWGSFPYDAFRTVVTACAAGIKTEVVRGWYVEPAGAAVNAERDGATPDNRSGSSLKVYGATGATAVRVGTYLPPAVTGLAQGTVVFSLYLYNGTGLPFTPSLVIATSTVAGDEGILDGAVTVAGMACAAGVWTRVSFNITIGVVPAANWKRGAQVALSITAGAGVMDNAADYVLLAQAGLDRTALGASWVPSLPTLNPYPAGMLMPWPGDVATIPAGWLYCNGGAMSRSSYRRLFDVIGTKYGAGDGSTTFNLPDLRGSMVVGGEAVTNSQGRLEVELSGCALNSTTAVTVPSTALLRVGMGAFHASIPAGAVIENITGATTVIISAAATATASPVTVRFSKLGTGDAQVTGAAGGGLGTGGVRVVSLQKYGCNAAASVQLTVGDTSDLVPGMVAAGAGIVGNPSIVAIRSATIVELSAVQTVGNAILTFTLAAPEGDADRVLALAQANPVVSNCGWSSDSNMTEGTGTADISIPSGLTARLRVGMKVTGTGIPADTYVTEISSGSSIKVTSKTVAAAITTSSGVTLSFTGGVESRGPAGSSILPRMVAMNWMIKV